MKEKKRGRPSYAEIEKRKLREAKKAEKLKLKGMGLAKGKAGTRSVLHPIQTKPTAGIKTIRQPRHTTPSMSRDASAENESGLMQAVVNLTSACMQLIRDNQVLIREVCQPLAVEFKSGMQYTEDKSFPVDMDKATAASHNLAVNAAKTYQSAVSPKVIVDGAKKKKAAAQTSVVEDLEDELDLEDEETQVLKSKMEEAPKKRGRPSKQKALPAPVDEEIEEEFIDDEEEEETEEDGDDGLGFSDDDDLSDVPFGAEPPSRKTKANGKIKHSPDLEDILS